jgi:hypothetical protein
VYGCNNGGWYLNKPTSSGGSCWFVGQLNQACSTVCNGRGGYSDATKTVAGSNGDYSSCNAVAVQLGGGSGGGGDNSTWNYPGVGCSLVQTAPGYFQFQRFTGQVTTDVAKGNNYRRFCACGSPVVVGP